ncbi:MAG TPA: protease inhibitor I42 family protein [Anaerolineales bacterium]
MLHKILSPVLLAWVLVLATACSPTKPVTLTAADKGSQVEVKVGEQIVITLDGNPSTGYTWEAKDLDTTMFEQVGDSTFNSSNPGLVGSGGTLTLTFKALKAGSASLTLVYHRPWETGVDPTDTFAVTVTVK